MSIKVLLVDDHRIVREGLHLLLGQDPEIEVVGEAANGNEAVEMAHQLLPDVVLMDLMMSEMDGIEAIQHIHKDLPVTQVLILTGSLEEMSVTRAVQAGAVGYLLKDIESQELDKAIKAVRAGQYQFSAQAVAHLTQEMREVEVEQTALPRLKELTSRELEVLAFLAEGFSNKEIALSLNVKEVTVKTHVTSIFNKLEVQSRTQAAYKGMQLGLVTVPHADNQFQHRKLEEVF